MFDDVVEAYQRDMVTMPPAATRSYADVLAADIFATRVPDPPRCGPALWRVSTA